MNRAQRRAKAKATPAYKRGMTAEDKIKAFYKNGITIEDMERSHREGYNEGWKAACDYSMRVCYAAAVRALRELEGYHTKRNRRFLKVMDSFVTDTLTSDEAIEAALRDAGVAIDFREAMPDDRIQEVANA